ncbi:signal peptide peptidase SppA [Wenyingzhuangia sp.]|uniref:signal peptide peptidase SppA n=1 Tax=Wenyingzhuangia sp. TaxID=1964193 RepID=UPI0032195719
MNFIKNILSSFVAIWLVIVVFILLGLGVGVSVGSGMVKEVKSNSILEIDLSGDLKDYSPVEIDPLSELLNIKEQVTGFNNVCKAIDKATNDDNIKGISIKNIPANIGLAQLTALRNILVKFQEKHKFIYAYNDSYTQKQYYLSSVANMISIAPLGYVDLKGLHSEVMFYKDFQEKYGIKMEVIRHGKYKSAVEPFIANEMSDANRVQISELIAGIWNEISRELTTSRNIDVDTAVEKMYGRSAVTSIKHGLVDLCLYPDEYEDYIKEKLAVQKLEKISMTDYMANISLSSLVEKTNQIAVIYAQGEIQYGEGSIDVIGQNKMISSLEKAAQDKNVSAIVLRVDSPGGSALASDLIWNAVEKAKKEKPVVVSMGNYAASGGYYISCGADRIFAEPTTITGSIGVFGIFPNGSGLAKKIGVNSEVVSTHENGAYYSAVLPLDSRYKVLVHQGIEMIYDEFLDRVSKGRNMSLEEVDRIAQGRVWTGAKAQELGLVDEIGGLWEAICYAAKIAEVTEYSIKELPKYEIDFGEMFDFNPFAKIQIDGFLAEFKLQGLVNAKDFIKTKGVQARIPFELMID